MLRTPQASGGMVSEPIHTAPKRKKNKARANQQRPHTVVQRNEPAESAQPPTHAMTSKNGKSLSKNLNLRSEILDARETTLDAKNMAFEAGNTALKLRAMVLENQSAVLKLERVELGKAERALLKGVVLNENPLLCFKIRDLEGEGEGLEARAVEWETMRSMWLAKSSESQCKVEELRKLLGKEGL